MRFVRFSTRGRRLKQLATVFMAVSLPAILSVANTLSGQTRYDLLLKGGHVIDGKNNVNAIRDLAITGGKISALAPNIDPSLARKVVDVSGLWVTPGLIDIHEHVYTYVAQQSSQADDQGFTPDGFAFRAGVTTVVDAGTSGWRTFEDFKTRVIDRSRTRVLALLNIVGWGKRGDKYVQDLDDMDAKPTARPPNCARAVVDHYVQRTVRNLARERDRDQDSFDTFIAAGSGSGWTCQRAIQRFRDHGKRLHSLLLIHARPERYGCARAGKDLRSR